MELEEKQEQKSQSEGSGCPVQQLKLYTAQLQTMMRLVLPQIYNACPCSVRQRQ